ncbi:MAG: ABC transporter substrate-binding protein [Candidatus Cloacimonadaceae bacterium]
MKRFINVLLAMLIILLLSACKTKMDNTMLRIGIIKPSIDHLPLTYAIQKGYLDAAKFKIVYFTSGWEVQEAITANRIDLAIMPFTYAWTAIAKGYKMKIISCLERETDGVIAGVKYNNINELHKKRIGLLRASTLEILMQDSALRNGIDYIPIYFRTPSEMIAALQTSDVDAIVSYVPLIQKLSSEYHVLHWFSETYPGHPCCDLVATEFVTTSHTRELQTVLTALQKAASDLTNPSEEVFELISNLYGLSRQQALEALQHTRFDVSLTESDQEFERLMMAAFIKNSYLKSLPANKKVFFK